LVQFESEECLLCLLTSFSPLLPPLLDGDRCLFTLFFALPSEDFESLLLWRLPFFLFFFASLDCEEEEEEEELEEESSPTFLTFSTSSLYFCSRRSLGASIKNSLRSSVS